MADQLHLLFWPWSHPDHSSLRVIALTTSSQSNFPRKNSDSQTWVSCPSLGQKPAPWQLGGHANPEIRTQAVTCKGNYCEPGSKLKRCLPHVWVSDCRAAPSHRNIMWTTNMSHKCHLHFFADTLKKYKETDEVNFTDLFCPIDPKYDYSNMQSSQK